MTDPVFAWLPKETDMHTVRLLFAAIILGAALLAGFATPRTASADIGACYGCPSANSLVSLSE
jgi:hypothetical protein